MPTARCLKTSFKCPNPLTIVAWQYTLWSVVVNENYSSRLTATHILFISSMKLAVAQLIFNYYKNHRYLQYLLVKLFKV